MAFVVAGWLAQVLIAVAISIIAYALQPKPAVVKPAAATDMDAPTADAGRPIPVVFGTLGVKGVNFLGYWDKQTIEYDEDA